MSRPGTLSVLIAAAATQFAAGIGFWAFSFLAPELAPETGLNERDFGLWITFLFLGALLSSPMTGVYVRRWGGSGTVARLFAVMIGAMALTLTGTWTGVMVAAFLFGLGYGPQGPIGMTLVTQVADPRQRGLLLALRHSAIPMAATVLGRALPPLMIWLGWRAGVLSVTGVLALALIFVLIAAPTFQVQATPARHQSIMARFRNMFVVPHNLRFLWGAGLVFALTQTTVTTFAYLYLLEVAHLSPIAAGIFASNLQLTALVGRPVLGWLTDRIGNAQLVLAGIAAVTVVASLWLIQVDPDTPGWVLIPLAIACGISGQCWNSVFVTAMSFKVDPGDLAELNGRAFGFLSLGWLAAPPIVWGLIELTGGYDVALMSVAAINAVVALTLVALPGR